MLLIKNAHIVSPGVDPGEGTLLLSDEGIVGTQEDVPAGRAEVIDAEHSFAVPGFFDIHCHGRSNFDFCDGTFEAFRKIGTGKLEDGVTSFLATTLSVSVEDLKTFFHAAHEYDLWQKNSKQGARLAGIHLEGPFINPPCAGAQNPAYLLKPSIQLVDELNAIHPIRKVSFSPELEGGLAFTRELVKRSIMPSGAHSEADYECFQAMRGAGMKHLTHFCNVMTPVHHLRFGMVGGGLLAKDVYTEIICDGVHLCDEMIRMISLLKGPERIMLITDAMRASAMPDGDYTLGGLPVKVVNGRATIPSGRVAGSTLRYHDGLKRLLADSDFPLSEALRATAFNQAHSLGIGNVGKLEKGFRADVTLLDRKLDPVMTIVDGRIAWRRV